MKILISSVGRRNYIVEYFQQCLNSKDDVIVVNSIEATSGMFASTQYIVAPPILSNEYIPFLIETCKKYDVELLLSLFDQDLMKISNNKSLFLENGIKVAISDLNVIETTFDKLKFKVFLEKKKMNTPVNYYMNDLFWKELNEQKIKFPLILKPRWGTGSLASQKVENIDELKFFFEYLGKKLKGSYINKISQEGFENEILIQEFIKGEEYHLDVINDLDGNYVTTFPKLKLGMRSGETESAITIKDDICSKIGSKIGNELRHVGVLDVDLIKAADDKYYIIDANPRFGGGYPFAHTAGANIPACYISWAADQSPSMEWLKIEPNVVSVKGMKIFKKGYELYPQSKNIRKLDANSNC